MPTLAYLECSTGIAGDMCLGALIHAGVPLDYLTTQLNRLGIASEYHLWTELVDRVGQQATKAHVDIKPSPSGETYTAEDGSDLHPTFSHHHSHTDHHGHSHSHSHVHSHTHSHGHTHSHSHPSPSTPHPSPSTPHPSPSTPYYTRNLADIEALIVQAGLPSRAEAWSLAVFRELAIAEAAVHGIPVDQVHFHEVGATDAIVDIVGTCLGLDWLGIDQLICSALPTGGGTFHAAHGHLPAPAPAVLKLWEMHQVPVYHNGIDRELVTPTGAAIAVTLATHFGAPPAMILKKIGLGAGSRQLPMPNILRLWIGESAIPHTPHPILHIPHSTPHTLHSAPRTPHPTPHTPSTDTVTVLETQIDDLNPQAIGYLFDALLATGALDVFTQAVGMKKSRPGILVTVICRPDQVEDCEAILFRETSTLGIRRSAQHRHILQREVQKVQTDYGTVRVKIAWDHDPDRILNVQPEYEDCAQLARQHNLPWREVHAQALHRWLSQQESAVGSDR